MAYKKDDTYKFQTYFLWVSISCTFMYYIGFSFDFIKAGFGSWLIMVRLITFCGIWLFAILSAQKLLRLGKRFWRIIEHIKAGELDEEESE